MQQLRFKDDAEKIIIQ